MTFTRMRSPGRSENPAGSISLWSRSRPLCSGWKVSRWLDRKPGWVWTLYDWIDDNCPDSRCFDSTHSRRAVARRTARWVSNHQSHHQKHKSHPFGLIRCQFTTHGRKRLRGLTSFWSFSIAPSLQVLIWWGGWIEEELTPWMAQHYGGGGLRKATPALCSWERGRSSEGEGRGASFPVLMAVVLFNQDQHNIQSVSANS